MTPDRLGGSNFLAKTTDIIAVTITIICSMQKLWSSKCGTQSSSKINNRMTGFRKNMLRPLYNNNGRSKFNFN